MSFSPFRTITLSLLGLLGLFLESIMPVAAASVREVATMVTSAGTMTFEMYSGFSPQNVANFKYLADTHYYDRTAFHRLIPEFMVQGGNPNTRGKGGQPSSISGSVALEYRVNDEIQDPPVDERAHRNRGTLVMANAGPNTNGSEFFVMFGPETVLDGNKYVPIGKMLTGDEGPDSALQRLEATSVAGAGAPYQMPTLESVSIRSVVTGTLSSTYPVVSVGGLLRTIDRSVSGAYKVTLTSKGGLSAQLQCYSRTLSFAGKLTPVTGSAAESEFVTHIDPKTASPIRIKIQVRRTGDSTGIIKVAVCKLTGTQTLLASRAEDVSTAVFAARELTDPSVISSQYTVSFDPPLLGYAQSTGDPVYSDTLKGSGFMSIKYLARTGVCTALGRLPDGHALSGSLEPCSEGIHDVLPVYLSGQSAGSSNSTFSGNMQLVPDQVTQSNLLWHRSAVTGTAASAAFDAILRGWMSKWVPPLAGQILGPFSYGDYPRVGVIQLGTLSIDGSKTYDAFQIGSSNSSTAFISGYNSFGIALRFNPTDGTFTGSYPDRSSGTLVRRTFDGICIQSGADTLIRGFSYRLGASVGVVIQPYR